MRCVLAVYLTYFWPGRWACLLPLSWDMPFYGFVAEIWGRTFSAWRWTSGFSTVYTGTVSLAICNVTAYIKAIHQAPFLSFGTQWLNDFANVGCFLEGVCGLPHSCASRSEQQVSHCDTCACLRCWNKLVSPLPLVASAFEKILQQIMVVQGLTPQNQATNETVLIRNKLLACCHVVVFVSLWKVNAGRERRRL